MTSRATMERLGRLANHVLAQSSPAATQQVVPHDASTGAGATTAGSQFADVVATLHNYFNGGHTGNAELIKSIWHPVASLKGVDAEGKLILLEPEEFFAAVAAGATKSDDPAILAADKIVSMEFTSPRTCLAKVEIAELNEEGEPVIYTDFLSLAQLEDDAWKVVSKIFAPRPLSAPSYSEPTSLDRTHAEIAEALVNYFESQASGAGSSAVLKRVFHEGALLRGPDPESGELRVIDAASFYANVDSAEWPTFESAALDKIIRIDKSGPNTACATVQIQGSDTLWTDHLSVLKLEGVWKIVHKTFTPLSLA
jgi:hypothetical protein